MDKPKGIEVVKDGIRKLKFSQQLKKAEGTKTPKVKFISKLYKVATLIKINFNRWIFWLPSFNRIRNNGKCYINIFILSSSYILTDLFVIPEIFKRRLNPKFEYKITLRICVLVM